MRSLKTIKARLLLSFASIITLSAIFSIILISLLYNYSYRYESLVMGPQERILVATLLRVNELELYSLNQTVSQNFGNANVLTQARIQLNEIINSTNELLNRYIQSMQPANDGDIPPAAVVTNTNLINSYHEAFYNFIAVTNELFTASSENNIASINGINNRVSIYAQPLEEISEELVQATINAPAARLNTIRNSFSNAANLVTTALIISIFVFIIIAILLIRNILSSIDEISKKANAIANGDLSVNMKTNSIDEIGKLSNTISDMLMPFTLLLNEIKHVSKKAEEGGLYMRIDEDKFIGGYKGIAVSMNSALNVLAQDSIELAEVMKEYAEGNFDATLRRFFGDSAMFNEAANGTKENLKAVYSEILGMIEAIKEGNTYYRINTSNQTGNWKELVEGLNKVLEAFSTPFDETIISLKALSEGKFVKMKGDYKGEFEVLKNITNTTIDNISSYIIEISNILDEMANKNLTSTINRRYVGEFSKIKDSLTNIISSFNNVISEIGSAAEQVDIGARQISSGAMNLATGASEQAANLEEINATIDLVAETSSSNLKSITNVDQFTKGSSVRANESNEDMQILLNQMESIKEFSTKIGSIITVIEDIAFQTNLLALNASVEAARAGEHGRGFAVVAEEVRALATRSQGAASETRELIEESINSVKEGTIQAEQTASSLGKIVEDSQKIANLIQEIAKSVSDQNESFEQIAVGISQVTSVVTSNSATSEEAASSSEELSSQADVMKSLVKQFVIK
ncbi:MAG: methyl-accepting chemotaxis protein [Defluviitaleaceae bacterium]|nr:methyl-accepting chemotaxis protein [Defluviitaleaceae bacterium]